MRSKVKMPKLGGGDRRRKPTFYLIPLAIVILIIIGVYLYRSGVSRAPLSPKEAKFMGAETLWGDFSIRRFSLPNGLTILIGKVPGSPVFAYQTWFKVGSRNERPERTGLAHLFEHLMFKGTKNYGDGEMDRLMEEKGSDPNASTFFDWTYYRQTLPSSSENIELVTRMEADRMVNLILNQKQLDSERDVVLNERRFRIDNDVEGKMYEQLYALAFDKHHYRWPIIGWAEDLKAASVEDCINFYRAYYAPNNAVVVIVGNVNENELLYFIEKYYGPLERQELPKIEIPLEPQQKWERRKEIAFETQAAKLLVGYHIPESRHGDLPAIEVLDAILFQGKSSRLYRTLVFEKGIATEVSGWVGQMIDPGFYEIQVNLRGSHFPKEAEILIQEEFERIRSAGIPSAELEKAKNMIEADFFRPLSSNEGKARVVGMAEVVYKDYSYLDQYRKKVSEVTVADIQRIAAQYLMQSNQTVVTVKPQGGGREE